MAKQLNINLAFTADTTQARQQVQTLQNQLTNLINQPVGLGQTLTEDIHKATRAAAELKIHLQNATNVNTGTLDFGKLNQSIKQSGMTLDQYAAKLQSLGPKGQQAFMTLANSVMQAEIPMRRTNALLTNLGTTLKNTAKWQISSSLLHGFMGSVQTAYNYAQDLNESLNNIRIVTGQNIDQMSKFAAEANKAARALSATTTEYTNASLIYYQQGLNDQEVKARTDVTIKMANVARQSAEIVSDQMTAIWNNFDDGSKSLEYYADVVTALGAATASSTDEIATGLEKFAAVAETVGLSYEYATAALATVTATTRQSADVVGTAFKTLFARIQDLDLGKTLDDGTTLGSYSAALAKVGVQVKDVDGSLRQMDDILNDMAKTWDTLGQAEQVALAKSVAGIRQYTQLIALMDNWDFMEENLSTVDRASGALQDQADIYAESWEAAQKRVQAARERIYASLFDDEFFIDLTNGFGSLIETVGDFVDSIGGLGGVLSGLGMIVTKVFAKQMTEGFRNLAYNIKMSTSLGEYAEQQAKMKQVNQIANLMKQGGASTAETELYKKQAESQNLLMANADKITAEEQERLQILMDQAKVIGEQSVKLEQQKEKLIARRKDQSYDAIVAGAGVELDVSKTTKGTKNIRNTGEQLGIISASLNDLTTDGKLTERAIQRIQNAIKALGKDAPAEMDKLVNSLKEVDLSSENIDGNIAELKTQLASIEQQVIDGILNDEAIQGDKKAIRDFRQSLIDLMNTSKAVGETNTNLEVSNKNMETSFKSLNSQIKNAVNKGPMKDWANQLTTFTNGLMSAGMMISSFNSLIDTLKNPDASGWEKFASVLASVSMIAMGVSGTLQGLSAVWQLGSNVVKENILAKLINITADYLNEKSSKSSAEGESIDAAATRENTEEINKNTAAKVANATADKIEFKGKKGQIRTFSGKKDHKGRWIDDNGDLINTKTTKELDLDGWTKNKGKGVKGVEKVGTKINPGALKTIAGAAAPVAVLAAGVIALGFSLSKASDEWNKHEIAADKAAKTAEGLAKRYDEVKGEVSEFNQTLDNYKSGVAGLEELTKGTIEYKQAVFEANEAALELIKNNKDLKYTTDSETGLIEIDEQSLLDAQAKNLEKMQSAQAASLQGQIDADNARLKADTTEFNRTYADSSRDDWGSEDTSAAIAAGGGAAAAIAGITAMSMINTWNPVGWAGLIVAGVGAAVMAGSAAVMGAANDEEQSEINALNDLKKAVQVEGNAAVSPDEIRKILAEKGYDEDLINSLANNSDETAELVEKMIENTQAVFDNTKAIVGQEYGADVAGMLTSEYDTRYKENLEYWQGIGSDVSRTSTYGEEDWFGVGNDESITQILDAYSKLTGSEYEWASNTVQKNENGDLVVYVKDPSEESGEKVLASLDEIITTLATQSALDEIDVLSAELKGALSNVSATYGESIANALSNFMNEGDFGESLTKEELDQLIAGLMGDDTDIENEEASEYLESVLGYTAEELSQMVLNYGGNIDAFVEDIETSLITLQDDFNNIVKGAPEEFQNYFNTAYKDVLNSQGVLLEDQKQFVSLMLSIYDSEGLAGLQHLRGLVEKIQFNDNQFDNFVSSFNDIDWNTITIDQLKSKMSEFGDISSITNLDLQTLISNMKNTDITVQDIGESFGELLNLLKDATVGTTYSFEEYSKFIELGFEDYFQIMYDGTYKLLASAKELEAAIRKKNLDDIVDEREKERLKKEDYEEKIRKTQGWEDRENFVSNIDGIESSGDDGNKTVTTSLDGLSQTITIIDTKLQNKLENMAVDINRMEDYGVRFQGGATIDQSYIDLAKEIGVGYSGIYVNKAGANNSKLYTAENANYRIVENADGTAAIETYNLGGYYSNGRFVSFWGNSQNFDSMESAQKHLSKDYGTELPSYNEATVFANMYAASQGVDVTNGYLNNYAYHKNGKMYLHAGLDGQGITVDQMAKEMATTESDQDLTLQAEQVTQALDFIETMGGKVDKEGIYKEDGSYDMNYIMSNWESGGVWEAIKEEYTKQYENYKELENLRKVAENEIFNADLMVASSAESLKELYKLQEEYNLSDAAIRVQAYALDVEREAKNLDTEEIEIYTEHLMKNNILLEADEELARKSAQATMRMNDAVETIQSSYVDWLDVLSSGNTMTEKYAQTLNKVKTAMADLLGVSEKSLSDSFLTNTENLKLMNEAANGSISALEQLSHLAAIDYVEAMNFEGTNADEFKETLTNWLTDTQTEIDDLSVGLSLDDEDFVAKLNEALIAGTVKIEEVEEAFNLRGLTLETEKVDEGEEGFTLPTTEVETPTEMVEESTREITMSGGLKTLLDGGPITITEKTTDAKTDEKATKTTVVGKVTGIKKYSAKAPMSSSSISTGSTAKSKSSAMKDKSGIERYKEITDAIDDVTEAAEKAGKAADRLWGGNRVAALKEQNKYIKEQIDLIKQEKAQAQAYLSQDQANLNAAAADLGQEISYDVNGNVTNATEIRVKAYDDYNNFVDSVYADGTVSEQEQFDLDTKEAQLDNFDKYLEQYDETREKIEDLDDEMDEAFYEWQDRNAEIWTLELELNLKVNDMEIERAQYYFDKLSDDFYKQAEAAVYLTDQIGSTREQLDVYTSSYADLQSKFNSGEISQAKFIERLEELRSGALENAQALKTLDDQMMEYYGNTLRMGQEEIAKYTDLMDNSSAVLEHYSSILKLVGKENDYNVMGQVLEAQVQTAKNEAMTARISYESFREQADRAKSDYDKVKAETETKVKEAKARGASEEEIEQLKAEMELLEKAWIDAENVAAEEQEKMLAATEKWAQDMQALYENDLAKFAQDLENSLTGGTSYDWLKTSMDRASASQEEYLTTTNKIYETNKLINETQKKIDETSNSAAKKRLKAFQDETKQKQQQGKLSQFELDIQQAKYDLLLAEIALEEAQNAKSTVTLQRDAEGNYGYIYTADSEETSNAEQAVADAENALYNIQLDGANNYAQKYQETLTAMGEALTAIRREDYESEEEYQNALLQTRDFYFSELDKYSDLYGIAVAEDGRVTEEAWSTAFSTMMDNTGTWKTNVETYLNNIKDTVNNYYNDEETGLPAVLSNVGLSFGAVTTKVGELDTKMGLLNGTSNTTYWRINGLDTVTKNTVTSSNNYLKTLVGEDGKGGIVKAVGDEATEVYNMTLKYGSWRAEVLEDITAYETLYNELTAEIATQTVNYDWAWEYGPPSADEVSVDGTVYYTADFSGITSPPTLYGNGTGQNFNDYSIGSLGDASAGFVRDSQGIAGQIIADQLGSGKITVDEMYREKELLTNGSSLVGWTSWNKWYGNNYIEAGEKLYNAISAIGAELGLGYTDSRAIFKELFDNYDLGTLIQDWKSNGKQLPDWYKTYASSSPYYSQISGHYNAILEKLANIYSFDTGGYTGEWGPAGKLAVLHEKELILNKDDTSNFLEGISILRDISTNSISGFDLTDIIKQLELQAAYMSLNSKYLQSMINTNTNRDALEQIVQITADFSGVSDRYEIEEAFNNLINEAAQYAYRR